MLCWNCGELHKASSRSRIRDHWKDSGPAGMYGKKKGCCKSWSDLDFLSEILQRKESMVDRRTSPEISSWLFRSSKTVVLLPPLRWKRTRVLRCHGGRWTSAAAKCGFHGEVAETLEGCWDVHYNAFFTEDNQIGSISQCEKIPLDVWSFLALFIGFESYV